MSSKLNNFVPQRLNETDVLLTVADWSQCYGFIVKAFIFMTETGDLYAICVDETGFHWHSDEV